MLTSLHIKNFKAWKDTGQIRLAPLTVIFGANSAGKSSLGHLMLALKQTAESTDRFRSLHLGDQNSQIDLGTFKDCLNNHDVTRPLEFKLCWKLNTPLKVEDKPRKIALSGDQLCLEAAIKADAKYQPRTDSLRYRLELAGKSILDVLYAKGDKEFSISSATGYEFKRTTGRPWPLEAPEKFYRISERSRAKFDNADFLVDLALATEVVLSRIYFLGPLRENPKRIYGWAGDTPLDVGPSGERAIQAILAADAQGRKINREAGARTKLFQNFIADWLIELGVIHSFEVKSVVEGRKEYEVLLRTHSKSSEVKLTDVGFGISQVLPALVEAFYAPVGSTIWMEQPEIHLHPQVQANLANAFVSAVKACENGKPRNVQLIIESHSEHFLNRLQLLVAKGDLSPNDVAIYFCTSSSSGAKLEPLEIDIFGEIRNWPENFFGNQMADVAGRTLEAIRRKQEAK
jgi:predicted ATPase